MSARKGVNALPFYSTAEAGKRGGCRGETPRTPPSRLAAQPRGRNATTSSCVRPLKAGPNCTSTVVRRRAHTYQMYWEVVTTSSSK